MSVIVTANFEGETFEVEIFNDGSLDFPDHDITYDQTVAALGGKKPATLKLYEYWHASVGCPLDVISSHIELPIGYFLKLASDWVDHVLYIYERAHNNDSIPRSVIEAVRAYADGKADYLPIANLRTIAGRFVIKHSQKKPLAPDVQVVMAAEWVGWAATYAKDLGEIESLSPSSLFSFFDIKTKKELSKSIYQASVKSRSSIMPSAKERMDTDKEEMIYANETAWQVRRFVDCMEAVGQGLPWPSMEATP